MAEISGIKRKERITCMEQNKTSEMVELNENELANVSGGVDGNNLLWGAGGAAVGAGAMKMLSKPKTIVQEKIVHLPANQDLLEKAGEVKKAVPVLKKAASFRL
jgi:bacteriocin-like protein